MFLLIIDAHSQWMGTLCANSATSSTTFDKLRTNFASHGLPEILESDNGFNFLHWSSEFKSHLRKNGIKHITSAGYHPASNGLVERAVRTLKEGIAKQRDGTVETKLKQFLLSYRIRDFQQRQRRRRRGPRNLREDWGENAVVAGILKH